MEQQCKIGGEGLRKNGDVVNEDRISELPDVLLLHILSSLPTETAIATSVLAFKDEESVSNLLYCCPFLEDLVVKRKRIANRLQTFTIAVPSLQRLTIEEVYSGRGEGSYVINCPSLKYLNLKGLNFIGFILIENVPELVEAEITQIRDIDNENILKLLSLELGTGKIFYQLLSLELGTNQKEWTNLLSVILDNSPKLQNLKLFDQFGFPKDRLDSRNWNQPKCVPECLLFHLETFVWKGYECQREDEKEVATYILENARCLKKATLSTQRIEAKELKKLEERRERLKELTSVVRASESCQLVCEAETYEAYSVSASPSEIYSESSRSASSETYIPTSPSASPVETYSEYRWSTSPVETYSGSSRSASPST